MKLRLASFLLCWFASAGALGHDHQAAHVEEADYQPPATALIVGQDAFRYELIPGWATGNAAQYTLGHCHAIEEDPRGRILLLNTSESHCLIALSPEGEVLDAWGNFAPNAHGLSIVNEGDSHSLFITDNGRDGKVFKTTLDGEILMTIACPMESGLYGSPQDFRPSKTLHLPNGEFFIIDGYGKDYIHRFDPDGKYLSSFGGDLGQGEARLEHFGPHGGNVDFANPDKPSIILALSDRNRLKRFSLEGDWLETILLPGSNPRDIVFHRNHLVVPHLGDAWPKDRNSAGYLSVLDRDFKVISNIGGSPPRYDGQGNLDTMQHSNHLFHHPHGICFDARGDLYVAQFSSNRTWPLKFAHLSQ